MVVVVGVPFPSFRCRVVVVVSCCSLSFGGRCSWGEVTAGFTPRTAWSTNGFLGRGRRGATDGFAPRTTWSTHRQVRGRGGATAGFVPRTTWSTLQQVPLCCHVLVQMVRGRVVRDHDSIGGSSWHPRGSCWSRCARYWRSRGHRQQARCLWDFCNFPSAHCLCVVLVATLTQHRLERELGICSIHVSRDCVPSGTALSVFSRSRCVQEVARSCTRRLWQSCRRRSGARRPSRD